MISKKACLLFFSAVILLAACTSSPAVTTPAPSAHPEATLVTTPTPSPTPVPTFVPVTPVMAGTEIPQTTAVITADNASRLTLFARWGNGSVGNSVYSPDGNYLLVASSTGIYFYSTRNYSQIKHIDLHTAIFDIAVTSDGSKFAATSYNKIFLFTQNNDEPVLTIYANARSIAFSPDGRTLAISVYDNTRNNSIQLRDTATGEIITEFEPKEDVINSITFSPDGALLATGGNATRIWRSDGFLLDWHGNYVSGGGTYSLSFSPDGTLLAEGADTDHVLHIWRVLKNGKLVIYRAIKLENYGSIFRVAISPDGKWLAAGTWDTIFLWQISTGALTRKFGVNSGMINLSWSPDSNNLVSAYSGGAKLWQRENGELLKTFSGFNDGINALEWLPGVDRIASGMENGTTNGAITLRNPHNGDVNATFEGSGDPWQSPFAFSPDGKILAVESHSPQEYGRVVITKLADSSFHFELPGSFGMGLGSGSFSRDGASLVTGGYDGSDSVIMIWNTSDGSLVNRWKMDNTPVGQLIYCPDGETVALVESNSSAIKFYRVSDGQLTRTIEMPIAIGNNPWLTAIAFSPDGKMLLTMSAENKGQPNRVQVLRMWRVSDGNLLFQNTDILNRKRLDSWPNNYSNNAIAWSPNGELFAVALSDGTIEIHGAGDGAILQTLSGHTLWVRGVAFSPDGHQLASASLDGTIRIWGVK